VHYFIWLLIRWKQESRAVAGKPRDAAVILEDGDRLPSWIWWNQK